MNNQTTPFFTAEEQARLDHIGSPEWHAKFDALRVANKPTAPKWCDRIDAIGSKDWNAKFEQLRQETTAEPVSFFSAETQAELDYIGSPAWRASFDTPIAKTPAVVIVIAL